MSKGFTASEIILNQDMPKGLMENLKRKKVTGFNTG
jgi:hypothetical protein